VQNERYGVTRAVSEARNGVHEIQRPTRTWDELGDGICGFGRETGQHGSHYRAEGMLEADSQGRVKWTNSPDFLAGEQL
jgi:hypothetical protein